MNNSFFDQLNNERNIFVGDLQILRLVFCDQDITYMYGINTQKVESIVELSQYTKLPKGNEPVIGMLDFYKKPVPIIDLSLIVINKTTSITGIFKPRIIICKLLNKLVGLLVPKTLPMVTIPNNGVLPTPDELKLNQNLPITGLYKLKNDYIMMIDIESILEKLIPDQKENISLNKNSILKGKKILVADDSKVVRIKLKNIFDKLGIEYCMTTNGQEALSEITSNTDYFDIILTDIEMPIMNGIQMARKIKTIPKINKIPIIFLTSISNKYLINDIEKENLGDYIIKFQDNQIIKTIEKSINKLAQKDKSTSARFEVF